jgi:DnaJ family protein B protein 12
VVSRAFQILSDSDKKSRYDKFGGDPDSRFNPGPSASSGGGGSPFSGFSGGGFPRGGGQGFDAEISPEEMFNRFFNGGFGGMGGGGFGPFGTLHITCLAMCSKTNFPSAGPQFVFNMGGGPGFRVHQFGGGVPRRRPRAAANNNESEPAVDGWGFVRQLLPLFLLFVLPLLSSLLSGSSTPAGPSYRFDTPQTPYTMSRTSPRFGANYFVNPLEVGDFSAKQFRELDRRVEVDYLSKIRYECESEVQMRERKIQEAQGWFFPDIEKMKEARSMEMKSCRRLEQLKGK